MLANEQLLDDLAGAVLDGDAIDWAEAESSAGADVRLVRHLRLVASVAQVHREALSDATLTSSGPVLTHATPPERWGHLRLLERVGRGAFGEVFRAWDTRLDREVALKLLAAAPTASGPQPGTIIQEGRLLARVRHPNVVTIHGAEQIGDQIGLWMEFVRGHTLEQLLRQGTVFTGADVVKIGLDLSRAVSAVHAAGLLHRDIKAHNVTRAEDGRVVLMDFGTGKELDDNSSSDLAGTPLYLAPEVMAGQPATVRSDIYSLGVLLYHLLTNSYPVRGRTIRDVRRAHERNERVGLRTSRPEVRPALARVIERAIDPQPERRYANVEALARDLAVLQRRPGVVRLMYGLAAAAAIVVVAALASDVRARLTGDNRSLGTRFASMFGLAPNYRANPLIAVLPFRNASIELSNSLLVESVTDGLIQQLAIIDGLEVRSRTSSFLLKDKPRDLADIGRRLNVNLVIEGDARLSGNRLVINASLVSIEDDRPVWSDTVDRELSSEGDVVGVVEHLTRKIVNELRLKLGRTQRQYKTDIPTYEIFLRALALRDARFFETIKAIPLFEEVLRRDPSYAPALAALALAHGDRSRNYPDARGTATPPTEADTQAEPLALKALEIDPLLPEAHAAIGGIHARAGRWAQAEESYRRAISLQPNLTFLYGSFVFYALHPLGRLDEALSLMQDAVRADPLSPDARRLLGRVQISVGHFDDALANCTLVLEQDPKYPFAGEICGLALMFKGRTDEALAWFNKGGRADLNEHWIGYIYAVTGRRAEAEALAARNTHLPHRPAMIYAALGDKDRAFEALEALALVNPYRAAYYLSVRELATLHDDPRAAILRQKLSLPR
ncbi:MAG TPA: protein kinase [Vicinamibacterales bacterium]|nr:protein kinase [Vicinamibacterales bacterium]